MATPSVIINELTFLALLRRQIRTEAYKPDLGDVAVLLRIIDHLTASVFLESGCPDGPEC